MRWRIAKSNTGFVVAVDTGTTKSALRVRTLDSTSRREARNWLLMR